MIEEALVFILGVADVSCAVLLYEDTVSTPSLLSMMHQFFDSSGRHLLSVRQKLRFYIAQPLLHMGF